MGIHSFKTSGPRNRHGQLVRSVLANSNNAFQVKMNLIISKGRLFCVVVLIVTTCLGPSLCSSSSNQEENEVPSVHHPHFLSHNHLIEEEETHVITNTSEPVSVGPLDSDEEEESARLEEEELEAEIASSEAELEEVLKAEEALGLDTLSDPVKREKVKAAAVQNLMQIFGLSETQVKVRDEGSESRHGPAPEFMIDLYNTITDPSGVTRANNPYGAQVVRSVLEKDASLNDYFYFNISSAGMETSESVTEAELHLFRMDTPRAQLHPSLFLNPFYVLSLYQVKDPTKLTIPDLHKLLAVHYVPALGSGWQVFNVKKAVLEWLSGNVENHGFLISAESVHGDRVPVRFARRDETAESKQPILVLFNHDSSIPPTPSPPPPHPRKLIKKNKKVSREDEEEEQKYDYTYETTTPLSSLENPTFHHALLFQDSIRHPNSVSRILRSRRSRNGTDSSSNSTHHHTSSSNLTSCGLHDLFVSFESIGWASWIISPKGYNAHYCDGPCVFPLGREQRPTNHATVQSIINELNLHPGLSRPCCVPTSLLPISLLYYDDQDNVVLKQYVDMVAESCGCH